jgi:hypothetical protein
MIEDYKPERNLMYILPPAGPSFVLHFAVAAAAALTRPVQKIIHAIKHA